jgi:CheY-like chemotaxis protein/HPt (histidine-containing phosphotransfer) domain-containing protein
MPPADVRGVRVLVVDDNATNREIVRRECEAWNMRPDEVADGDTALRRLREAVRDGDPYRVAVVDMQMPEMDGESLGKAVRADAALDATHLVMMTSLGRRGDARRLEEIGFAAYLTKPVRQSDLFDGLAAVLSGQTRGAERPLVTRHALRELRRGSVRILLAEDNATNQQVALGILAKLGLSADAVANGLEAIEALKAIPYDLILMDVQMPEMDGHAATRAIRGSSLERRDVPIVAMTAHAMQGDREACLAAGMNDYLSKPVDPQALAAALDKWLPKRTARPGHESHEAAQSAAVVAGQAEDSTTAPVFDRAALLARLMDDEDLARAVTEGFLEDIPKQIEALQDYLEAGDAASAERQAHTIKGASANVGAEALREIALAMETEGKAGDLEAVRELLPELRARFERLREAMAATL